MLVTLSFYSCGVNTSMVQSHNLNQSQVTLDKANFIVIDLITGKDSATYILGIGGLRNRSTLQNAYSDMLKSADLQGRPRAIINVTHETHLTSILSPIFLKKTVFVHGLLIEFTDGLITNNPPSKGALDESIQDDDGFGEKPDRTPSAQQNPGEAPLTHTTPPATSTLNAETPKSFIGSDCAPGDKVKFTVNGVLVEGVVLSIRAGSTQSITATYTDAKGRKKKAYLKPAEIIEKLN